MTADEDKGFELTDLVDADNFLATFLGFFGRLFACALLDGVITIRCHPPKVGVISGLEPMAGRTFATGRQVRLNGFAKQKRRKLFGECSLADSGRPDQQHGVRKPVQPSSKQLFPYGIVPLYIFIIRMLQQFSRVLY